MIHFKTLSIKNFLSYGNVPTVWELDKHKSTLIIGKNGNGKSTVLDGVCFALFGKPFRSINKPQLINSINGKNCVVELELLVDQVHYKIIRGIKPNVFEVYRDGKMLDQEAAMRDMQEFLETNVIKLNFRTFCQVVILGSASFTPFMKLPAYQRREVIEDILDIGIFSKMNQVLKDRVAGTKEELRITEVRVEAAKKESSAQKRIIELIEKNKTERISEIERIKEETLEQFRVAMAEKVRLNDDSARLATMNPEAIREECSEVRIKRDATRQEIAELQRKLKKLSHLESCPTCLQEVTDSHKEHIETDFMQRISSLTESVLNSIESQYDRLSSQVADIDKLEQHLHLEHNRADARLQQLRDHLQAAQEQIDRIRNDSSDLDAEKQKLKQLAADALKVIERRSELLYEKQLQEISSILLKDSGIKTAIIREYLPVLNKLINKYLHSFDFFVNFNLDENFNEVIKSRGRDEFSYASFSEGEKKRLDLAILLAFRQIAAMKNSAKVNLIMFDEVVDSSLDLEARAKFNELLESMEDSNVFVISHTDTNTDAYDAVIKVEKVGDFSKYTYV